MDFNNTGKSGRRKFLTRAATSALTGLAGLSFFRDADVLNAETSKSNSGNTAIIDGHSHMLMGLYESGKQKSQRRNLMD